jgi:peptide/nickel transport system permease protein
MKAPALNATPGARAEPSRFRAFARRFAESKLAVFGLVLLAVLLLLTIFAPLIAPQNPYDLTALNILDAKQPPGGASMDGAMTYLLGSDGQGRDVFSAILYGMRISLFVGVVSIAAATVIGTILGLIGAYFGGWIDALIMRVADLQLSFPAILTALILMSIFGRGVDKVIYSLILVEWAYIARVARGAALTERNQEYVEATRSMALSSARILFRHILPNCLSALMVVVTVDIARAILLEAVLSFLGVGASVTEPSLGLLISNGFQFMLSGSYWISFFPGVALTLLLIAINLVADQLRDVLNPRLAT